MPHAVVDYSDSLTGAFDRRAFALELHALVVEILDTAIGNCKTRFHRLEESVVGEGTDGRAVVVHVEMAIAGGRTAQTKSRLTRAVLELVERHTAKAAGLEVHASVDVRDLGEAYTKSTSTP
ncbi:5-carboxymethyl-2-hydroxymuconate Delta-isomerase [Streptomyces sp. NPDC059496]|uniref:5-carboxymethyl-2-hydroxymuconate Delta-isomerase n=1 Tax=Streptomyces sp. NPDC059496 TaxID=3346851 RepID=UPI0036ADECA3